MKSVLENERRPYYFYVESTKMISMISNDILSKANKIKNYFIF